MFQHLKAFQVHAMPQLKGYLLSGGRLRKMSLHAFCAASCYGRVLPRVPSKS
jgi:hypothetical protein